MGCCLTTPATTRRAKFVDQMPEESGIYGGAPPPEEETVKEVLSETQTPISVSHTTMRPIPTTTDNLTTKVPLESNYRSKEVVKEEEITVVSEMYSSGSCSTTTAKDGDDGDVNQRMMHQSPARRRCNSRANSRANHGGLGSLSSSNPREITRGLRSPVRLNQVRSGPFRGRKAMVQHHNVGCRDGDWTGLVKRTSRKLGSPNDVIGRHRTAASSVSGRSQPVRKVETSKNIDDDDDDDRDGAVSMESLENPRVSLECFIFL